MSFTFFPAGKSGKIQFGLILFLWVLIVLFCPLILIASFFLAEFSAKMLHQYPQALFLFEAQSQYWIAFTVSIATLLSCIPLLLVPPRYKWYIFVLSICLLLISANALRKGVTHMLPVFDVHSQTQDEGNISYEAGNSSLEPCYGPPEDCAPVPTQIPEDDTFGDSSSSEDADIIPEGITNVIALRYRHQTEPKNTTDPWNAMLVKRDRATGKETTLIPDLKKVLPHLNDRDNHTLLYFAQPLNTTAIFQDVWAETDAGGGAIYKYDLAKNSFELMQVNSIFGGDLGHALWKRGMYKDQTKIAWVPDTNESGDEKAMYLIDLVNDRFTELVRLHGNETFDAADFAGGIGSQSTDISWVDAHTVRYAVFDQTKKPADDWTGDKIRIEYRTVYVP